MSRYYDGPEPMDGQDDERLIDVRCVVCGAKILYPCDGDYDDDKEEWTCGVHER